MTLKLPYIPGRDIKAFCDREGIPATKKDCQRAAIAARKIEREVLGEYHKPEPVGEKENHGANSVMDSTSVCETDRQGSKPVCTPSLPVEKVSET